MARGPRAARALAVRGGLAILGALLPVRASAQGAAWQGALAASASLFFGASSQRLVASSASLARADSTLSLAAALQFRYGEASEADSYDSEARARWARDNNDGQLLVGIQTKF